MKVAIAYGGNPKNRCFIQQVIKGCPEINFLTIEEDIGSIPVLIGHLTKRIRRYGLLKTLDMIILQIYKTFTNKTLIETPRTQPNLECKNINSGEVSRLLNREKPDLLVLFSTGIVKKTIFEIPKQGTINLHPGINPRYRGAGGSFWALYDQNYDLVGYTIHKVTSKIDEGEIFRIGTVSRLMESIDSNLEQVFREGTIALIDLLKQLESTKHLTPLTNNPFSTEENKIFGYFGLSHYIKASKTLQKKFHTNERVKMIRKYVPYFLYRRLFGDRKQFGTQVNHEDHEFKEYMNKCSDFYNDTQQGALGTIVNDWGFQVLKNIDFFNKTVMEIGPGVISHQKYHNTLPNNYILYDIREEFLEKSYNILKKLNYPVQKKIARGDTFDLEDNTLDLVLSFHQLEHVQDLDQFINEIHRVLKPGGFLVGSIPTEGGIAWGTGRYFTSRRYCKKNYSFNYDKIICWEHPNYADKIKHRLNSILKLKSESFKPFWIKSFDFNLSYSFIFEKPKDEHVT